MLYRILNTALNLKLIKISLLKTSYSKTSYKVLVKLSMIPNVDNNQFANSLRRTLIQESLCSYDF